MYPTCEDPSISASSNRPPNKDHANEVRDFGYVQKVFLGSYMGRFNGALGAFEVSPSGLLSPIQHTTLHVAGELEASKNYNVVLL
jgi:hypothetical protein